MNLYSWTFLTALLMAVPAFGADGVAVEAPLSGFYSTKSPVQLLDELAVLNELNPGLKGNITLPHLDGSAVRNWLTDEQLSCLIKLANDDRPCLRAVNFLSSIRIEGSSTVGVEASRMVLGAIYGAYPQVTPYGMDRTQLEPLLNSFLDKSKGTHD